MFTRFDANKSTKGASKLRRDLINAEIANLRDLLPLPQSTRQRLSQLQLMALVCVYVRKANYFQQVFKRHDVSHHQAPTPNIGFSKALSGFLMMLTQNGKLLYISDNAAEYLGHSMEDLLIHGDSVYDIIDKQDHGSIQAELGRSVPAQQTGSHHPASPSHLEGEQRMFLCRMNVSRNARRQMRFGDQKVVLVQGHYLSFLPLCSRNEPVFLATCTPIAMPETRECVVQGATNVFTTIHSMDMKIVLIDKNGEFHLGYNRSELQGISWYHLLHWDSTREAQAKHRLITQSEQDRSGILLVQMQRRSGDFIWVHCVLQVRDGQDSNQQPVIVCTNQVLSDREASVMLANSWLYHYYSVQSKIQFGLPFEGPPRVPSTTPYYHHPPPTIQPTLTHHSSPHHVPYGYHSPIGVGPHQGSPSIISHHHNGAPPTHHQTPPGLPGDYYKTYTYHRYESQPVDYSQATPPAEIRCSSRGSASHRSGTPPSKRRAIGRLEPLYIPDEESPESTMMELQAHGGGVENGVSGQTVILSTVAPRPRLFTKAPPVDSPDFMEQWNPSPPWSETAQKVPDIAHQELSPYLTTTPPTPTSATAPPHSHTFSFDWVPEQFVPVDCGIAVPVPLAVPLQIAHWPADHSHLMPMQPPERREDADTGTVLCSLF
ncbi:PAS domain-containing protein cky-1 isoform X2 [Phlebotomus papatasi]|uniref:PAS domain-containing protein cky-1 isoform X2 n=1 Tax=Phlebotomus papatasi TaxID=29031 RepID=UPI0024842F7C|nr:PAS domain-containing protein cky-1 isoform X2 [Phlebotomus papatasi]